MNEKNSGKRVRPLQKPLVIAGIIVGLALMLVAAIAIPYFLRQRAEPKYEGYRPGLEPYYIDPNWYPAAGTVEASQTTVQFVRSLISQSIEYDPKGYTSLRPNSSQAELLSQRNYHTKFLEALRE